MRGNLSPLFICVCTATLLFYLRKKRVKPGEKRLKASLGLYINILVITPIGYISSETYKQGGHALTLTYYIHERHDYRKTPKKLSTLGKNRKSKNYIPRILEVEPPLPFI